MSIKDFLKAPVIFHLLPEMNYGIEGPNKPFIQNCVHRHEKQNKNTLQNQYVLHFALKVHAIVKPEIK